jgi:hypothetical protein
VTHMVISQKNRTGYPVTQNDYIPEEPNWIPSDSCCISQKNRTGYPVAHMVISQKNRTGYPVTHVVYHRRTELGTQ